MTRGRGAEGSVWGLPCERLILAQVKARRGHLEPGDAATGDLLAAPREELRNVAGYAELLGWRGLWTWRVWAVVALSGLQWRLLRWRPVRWWRLTLALGLLGIGRPAG